MKLDNRLRNIIDIIDHTGIGPAVILMTTLDGLSMSVRIDDDFIINATVSEGSLKMTLNLVIYPFMTTEVVGEYAKPYDLIRGVRQTLQQRAS